MDLVVLVLLVDCETVKGADTKIELGFSMTLAGATPGIHPEGRRLGALRLGRRLETPKSQVWFLRITGELRPVMGFTTFYARRTRPLANTSRRQATTQSAGTRTPASGKKIRRRASAASPAALFWELCTRSPLARRGAVRCISLVDMVWRPYGRTSVRAMGR